MLECFRWRHCIDWYKYGKDVRKSLTLESLLYRLSMELNVEKTEYMTEENGRLWYNG